MGSKGGGSVTVGFRYFLGMHMVCCHGPIDRLHEVWVGEKKVWPLGDDWPTVSPTDVQQANKAIFNVGYGNARPPTGEDAVVIVPPPPGAPATPPPTPAIVGLIQGGTADRSGTIYINAPDIFGGEAKEGGVQGYVDLLLGESTLGANRYLQQLLGAILPAFRGVFGIVVRQCYVAALNPYIKPWSVFATRIFKSHNGGPQWYPEKAAIPDLEVITTAVTDTIPYAATGWKYIDADGADFQLTTFDDSEWLTGQAPFGTAGHSSNTIIPSLAGKHYWVRRLITMESNFGVAVVSVKFDDSCQVFWNGVEVPATRVIGPFESEFTIDPSLLRGINTLAIRGFDAITGETVINPKVVLTAYTVTANAPDMNPAHIIRECLVSRDWGKGYSEASVDDVAFTAAANTLYTEDLGISTVWMESGNIDDFIKFILEHIDGNLYTDRVTGLWTLTLVRDDYDIATIPSFGPDNVLALDDFARPASSELTNRIVLTYWDKTTRKNTPLTLDNQPLQEANNGNVISQALDRTGFTESSVAARVAQRELKTLSSPLASGTMVMNREGMPLRPGSVYKFTWPELGVVDLVLRVATIDYGTLTASGIRVSFVEDVFATPTTQLIAAPVSQWQDPRTAPAAMVVRYVNELPYWTINREITGESASRYAEIDPISNALAVSGMRQSADTLSAAVYTSQGAGAYGSAGVSPLCASMVITNFASEKVTILPFSSVSDPDRIAFGRYAAWDNELVLVYDFNVDAGTLTVARAVLDTVPAQHAPGSRILFVEGYQFVGRTQYTDTEVVNVKMLPKTPLGELLLGSAPVDAYTFGHRHIRPYPPGNVKVNGAYFPVVIAATVSLDNVTWAHRNRLSQTVYLVGFTEASITPEVGTTYNLKIYGEAGILLRSESVSGEAATAYPIASELLDSGLVDGGGTARPNCRLTLFLESERDTYKSWQSHNITLDRADYGYSYGRYYGGYL